MKKNAFTLVELLAVIAILAILVIIALPNVMGMFNEAKKNSFTTEAKEIFKVAEQEWMGDSMFETNEVIYSRVKGSNCTNELQLSGRQELNYYIRINKSGGVVEYYLEDGSYQYSYSGSGLKVEDIGGVLQLADIDDSQKIKISCDRVTGGTNSNPTNVATCVEDGCDKKAKATELIIAEDNFLVVSSSETETVLLAKYDLNTSYEQETSGNNTNLAKMKFANSGYWDECQSNTLSCTTSSSGLLSPYNNSANPVGATGTYGRYTKPYPYVYDSNSNLYQYVEAYIGKLRSRLGLSISGRLLSYEEAETLSRPQRNDLNNHYYWLGSASSYDNVGYVDQYNGQLRVSAMGLEASVRPVIIIPTSSL